MVDTAFVSTTGTRSPATQRYSLSRRTAVSKILSILASVGGFVDA